MHGAKVAEGGRQAVGAMLPRRPAQRPERVLQPFGECDKALPAKYDVSMLKAGEGEPEVVETMVEEDAGDGSRQVGDVGEVRKSLAAGLVLLAEDHVPRSGLLCRPPGPDAPLQRPSDVVAKFRMPRRRISSSTAMTRMPGAAIRIGTTSALPNRRERVRVGVGRVDAAFCEGKAWIGFNPIAGGGRKACLQGGEWFTSVRSPGGS